MLLDVEQNEDLTLVLDSVKELLNREWEKYGNKKHEVEKDKIFDLFYKLKDIGLFDFLKSTSEENVLIINEALAQYFLPGIIATTIIALSDVPTTIGINYVPELDKAELVITPKGVSKASDIEAIEVKSPDPSVRLYKIVSGKWEKINEFDRFLINASAQIVGHGIYCLNKSIEYSKNRITFGKPIGSYQAIKHKIVDDAIGLELARSRYLMNRNDSEKILEYSFNKSFRAILDSIQIHGGIGFTTDMDLHLHLKRVVMLEKILTYPTQGS